MKTNFLFLLTILICSKFTKLDAQDAVDWQSIQTIEAVYQAYPERINTLLQSINLEQDGLASVKKAFEQGDIIKACQHLLQYYQDGETATFLRRDLPSTSSQKAALADSIRQGIFTFYTQTDKVPLTNKKHLDWSYSGPTDDIEWAWALNRHSHLKTLLRAYLKTGNPGYAKTIDQHVKSWVISSLPYPAVKSSTAMWRGLEVSFRVKRWAEVFYGLIQTQELSPATQLLLLSSIPEHAHYLRNFHAQGNWLTMEMSALAMGAVAWPEFKQANEWLPYSQNVMTESLKEQIYPDGVQTELTAHYHYVALNNFDQFLETAQQANTPLPDIYPQQIEKMWNYLAYSMRPSGTNPLNNDSDLRNYQDQIMKVAQRFDRPDWLYLATNGSKGKKPTTSSSFFPYAGQVILRKAWDKDAHWAFFDIGPWGSGHQHNDKLHLSLSAFGRDLLVDGGRFSYKGAVADQFRDYARGSESHNVLLIDGKGQAPGPKEAKEPLTDKYFQQTEQYDLAWGAVDHFDNLTGEAAHTRSVAYVPGKFWIVVDQVDTDRPRTIQALWHWHPNENITIANENIVRTNSPQGNLQLIPLGSQKWNIKLIKGQETPKPQGWYSEEYNKAVPNTCSVYETTIKKDSYFVWLLYPSDSVTPKVKAQIISQTEGGLNVSIKSMEGKWNIYIPFPGVRGEE